MPEAPLHAVRVEPYCLVREMSRMAYGRGNNWYHYRGNLAHEQAGETVPPVTMDLARLPQFWRPAADLFAAGDRIFCACADGAIELYVQSVERGWPHIRVLGRTS